MPRNPLLYIACGKKGIGKTYITKQLINRYFKGDSMKGTKPRKVLIIDVNNEFGEYKRVRPSDILKFSYHPTIEARRISIYKEDGQPMTLNELKDVLYLSLLNFKGGLLIVEDMTKYISDTISADIVGSLCTQRHTDTDVIIHFQSIGKAGNPKIVSNMNILRLHKCLDTVERHKDKFDEKTEILKIAENIVNKQYDEELKIKPPDQDWSKHYVYINFDRYKISGNFTKEEFMEAVTQYCQENENETIKKLMKQKDRKGKKLYDYEAALIQSEKELFDKYYSNP